MTTEKKKKVSATDSLREQLHEAVNELRALQREFQRTREAREQSQPRAAKCKPPQLTRLADDLDLAVDAMQASVTRLETRLLPLLPEQQGVTAFSNVSFDQLTRDNESALTCQLSLAAAHIKILTSIIDELAEAVNL